MFNHYYYYHYYYYYTLFTNPWCLYHGFSLMLLPAHCPLTPGCPDPH